MTDAEPGTYRRTETFQKKIIGPDGDTEWNIPADSLRADGMIAFRSIDYGLVAAIVSPDDADTQFEQIPSS